ncbi:MAG: MFS transporter, partial [Thermoleophilia bacterium]|nr:MFS transporter [Thermoleophilia bacterium]
MLYAERELALGPALAGLLLAGFGLATAAAVLAAGTVGASRPRPLLKLGVVLLGAGLVGLGLASTPGDTGIALLAVAGGFGIVSTLGFPVFASYVPPGEEAAHSALYFATRSVASLVALPAAGWSIALAGSYRALPLAGGAVALLALVPLARVDPVLSAVRAPVRLPRSLWLTGWTALLVAATATALAAGLAAARLVPGVDAALFGLLRRDVLSPRVLDGLLVDP